MWQKKFKKTMETEEGMEGEAEEPKAEDMEVTGGSVGQGEEVLSSQQLHKQSADPAPIIHIQYFGNDHSQGIYQLVEAYMLSLQPGPEADDLKLQVSAVTGEVEGSEVKESSEAETTAEEARPDGATPTATPTNANEEEEEEDSLGEVEYYREYCVDKYALGYKPEVLFDQIYTEPFWVDSFVAKEERRLRKMAIKCFNCGEDHHINSCPEPRDPQRILTETRLFKESLGTLGADKRYHLSAAVDRFSKFSPGQISARLRLALGIGPTAHPPYIARMCLLGYPPGYKLQAEEQGLRLYHTPDTGDVVEQAHTVVVYPGFNDKDTSKAAKKADNEAKVVAKQAESVGEVLGAEEKDSGRVEEDDLGSISDYELEEMEAGEDGEIVVGFRVRNAQDTTDKEASEKGPVETRSKEFSLDFPPGLVDIHSTQKPSSHKWNALKKLLFSRT